MREAIMTQDAPHPNRVTLVTETNERPDRNPPGFEDVMKREREAKSDDDVRQGITGQGVRYVLAASLGGALVALLVLYATFTPG